MICVGDRKERVRCLPSWEADIIRKYVNAKHGDGLNPLSRNFLWITNYFLMRYLLLMKEDTLPSPFYLLRKLCTVFTNITFCKKMAKKNPRNSDSSIYYRENFSVYVDPIIGIIFVISLLWSSYSLAVDSSNILLQTIPGSLVKFYPSRCLFCS